MYMESLERFESWIFINNNTHTLLFLFKPIARIPKVIVVKVYYYHFLTAIKYEAVVKKIVNAFINPFFDNSFSFSKYLVIQDAKIVEVVILKILFTKFIFLFPIIKFYVIEFVF